MGIQGLRVAVKNNIEVCLRGVFGNQKYSNLPSLKIWTRQLAPTGDGNHSNYAVAFVSQRTDGNAYRINIQLSDIHLDHSQGYEKIVKLLILFFFRNFLINVCF